MLAQLDKLDGIAESRVDWLGRKILIRLKGSADPDSVTQRAAAQLGSEVVRMDAGREKEQIEGFRRGEPWMRAGETLELSRRESKVLGKSLAAQAGRTIRDEDLRRRLETALEEEFFALFSKIHAGELTLGDAFERAETDFAPKIRKRLLEFLSPDQTAEVMSALRESIFGGDQ